MSAPQQSQFLLPLFFFLCLVNLYAEWTQQSTLIFLSKPLLMTVLAAYFYGVSASFPARFRRFIFLGVIFAIGGDTLLMFVEHDGRQSNFFLYGLISFLFTHLCYLYAFATWSAPDQGLFRRYPWLFLLFAAFLAGNMLFLWPDIPKPLRIPVLVYSTTIVAMAASCVHLYGKIDERPFTWLMIGVVLFVISDNIIALNKFKSEQMVIPYARILIMLTYLTGQYCIVRGAIILLALSSPVKE